MSRSLKQPYKYLFILLPVVFLAGSCNMTNPQPQQENTGSEMKTYESDLGYSVSYPSSWVVSADDTIAPASPEIDNDMLTVYFRARVENAAFRDVSANLRKTFAGSSNIEMIITFGLKGTKAPKFERFFPVLNLLRMLTGKHTGTKNMDLSFNTRKIGMKIKVIRKIASLFMILRIPT